MLAATASNVLQNFDQTCDDVIQNYEPVIIARENGKNVVLISQAEYDSLLESIEEARANVNR